jgi:uncharacterized protein YndB with AHSA1/START domain
MTHPTTKVTQAHRAFTMVCGVEVNVLANAGILWRLLTDAEGFPRWNSTVSAVEGQIREGERLRLRVPGTDRVFTPKISGVVPNERMTWTGGFAPIFKGVRTFVLRPRNDGSTAGGSGRVSAETWATRRRSESRDTPEVTTTQGWRRLRGWDRCGDAGGADSGGDGGAD